MEITALREPAAVRPRGTGQDPPPAKGRGKGNRFLGRIPSAAARAQPGRSAAGEGSGT